MTSKLLLLWIITTHFAFTWMFVHFMLKACTNTMKDNFPNQYKWICTCCIQLLCGWALQGSGHAEGHHTCILSKQQHLSWAYPCSDGSFNLPNPALTQPHLSHWKLQAQTVTQQGGSAWRQHVRTQQGPVHLLDHLNSTTRSPSNLSVSFHYSWGRNSRKLPWNRWERIKEQLSGTLWTTAHISDPRDTQSVQI